jgi:hypothetical protein
MARQSRQAQHQGLEHPRLGVAVGLSGLVGIAFPLIDHNFILLGFLLCWGSAAAICLLYFAEWRFAFSKFKKPVGYQRAADKRPVTTDALISPIFVTIYFLAPILIYFAATPSSDYYISQWGTIPGLVEQFQIGDPGSYRGPKASHIIADGKLIKEALGTNYRLVGVCLHHSHSVDILDEPNISKSGPYDIVEGYIEILIYWNETFLRERVSGYQPTIYQLLALPIDKAGKDFTTMRQAVGLGGRVLAGRTGPP